MMQRTLRLALALLLVMLMLTGCGSKPAGTGTDKQIAGQTDLTADPKAHTEIEDAYRPILDEYFYALENNSDDAILGWGLSPLLAGKMPEQVGYVSLDLNEDGNNELLIVSTEEDNFLVYAVYTLSDGQAAYVTCSDDTYRYNLLYDEVGYMLFNEWDYPGVSNGYDIYYLNEYGGLSSIDTISCREDGYYRRASDFDMVGIDSQEFFEVLDSWYALFVKADGIPFDTYDYTGNLSEADIPSVMDAAWIDASPYDLAAVWVNPSEVLVRQAGGLQLLEDNGDIFVFMALQDNTTIRLDSGEPVFTEDYYIDGWDTEYTLYEATLNAGESLALQINVSEGIPNRCIIASTDQADSFLSTMWPLSYPGAEGWIADSPGGCFYLTGYTA